MYDIIKDGMKTISSNITTKHSPEICKLDQKSMAQEVYENVLSHLLNRALNGEERREFAGYFAINLDENDHSEAFNHFRSLFGVEVDPNEYPLKPLNNRVLASYGNFALVQQVQYSPNDETDDLPVAYGVSISVIGLTPERGGPLVVKSV
jgi:hypothetical protein